MIRAPLTEARLLRRFTVASTIEEQIARELVTRDELRNDDSDSRVEHTIRINFHCNQSCEFCFVSTHLPAPAEESVRRAIAAAAAEQAVVVLSGGEPTLNPELLAYVELAKQLGAPRVDLQTNAIRFSSEPTLARDLAAAGVDTAMVSLHGSHAEISDVVTSAPGTFEKTVVGLDRLRDAGISLRLNFVFCQANRGDFDAWIDLVGNRWPAAQVVVSFVGSHTDVVPRSRSLIPRFSDILPDLERGLERAMSLGLDVRGFDSMCGLPLCLVPKMKRSAFANAPTTDPSGGGEFVKGPRCRDCAEAKRCYGVRQGYAELHGTDELQPF